MNNSIKRILITPGKIFWLCITFVLIAALFGPNLVQLIIRDGGFERYGWNIDLATWNKLSANQGTQAVLHTDLIVLEDDKVHKEFWINTGQSITFRQVPTSESTYFSSFVRIHPAWNPGAAIDDVSFRATIRNTKKEVVFYVTVSGIREEAGGWKQLTFDLAQFIGENINIEIKPVSRQPGIWTLWRDPKIAEKNL